MPPRKAPTQKRDAKPYDLRVRPPRAPLIETARRAFRDYTNYIYRSDIGERAKIARKGMPARVTTDLLADSRRYRFSSSVSRRVTPLAGGKPELKRQNASRDHILADSHIRAILTRIFESYAKLPAARGYPTPDDPALARFFESLCGKEVGAEAHRQFVVACLSNRTPELQSAIDTASNGLMNLRFGLADVNTAVSNSFDPVVVNGRLDERSTNIRDSVLDLTRPGFIDVPAALDATALAKDRHTHQNVTSTVLKTPTMSTETGSRTSIDYFALPVHPASVLRRHSVDLQGASDLSGVGSGNINHVAASDLSEPRPNINQVPAAEWHHTTRRPMSALGGENQSSDLTGGARDLDMSGA